MKKGNPSKASILSQKAEGKLKNHPSITFSLPVTDTQKLLHEHEVYQVELEMQILELRLASTHAGENLKAYNEIYDNAQIGYFSLSKEGEISKLNLMGSKMLGKGRSQLLGSRFGFFISDDTESIFNLFFEKVFTSKTKEWCKVTLLVNDCSHRQFLISGIASENGTECLMTLVDTTELHEVKNKLAIANKELAYQNEEKQKRADELVIANKELAYQNEEKQKRADELIIANKELAFQNEEKDKRVAELIIANEEKDKRAIELIKAKEKAEESDRLKSAFLTNMSHEIRTPMNGILGFTELLKERNLSSDDQQDFIQTIQISSERMLSTINSIIDMSKIESGLINLTIDETDINKMIEFTYKFFKPEVERKGLQFTFKNGLLNEKAVIRTDNEKVHEVLTNLIKNAIKFTNDGSIEFGYVIVRTQSSASLQFYVKDTGVGIPKYHQQTIFERFRQGNNELNRLYEGSGLGLSIAKSYIEMLGGKIWVESEEGKGSTFYFTIPYNSVKEEKIEIKNAISAELKEVQMKSLKILIVEDDEVSYSFLTRTLQKISLEVLHAITGVQAIEACRSNSDLDLVLMDIRMPIMDGNEATRQIRQFNKDVIIIAQTAYAFAGDSEKAIEAGCNDYITKPITKTLLFELIKKHCNR